MIPEPRLALLFLTTEEEVRQPAIWRDFLAGGGEDLRIYSHPKVSLSDTSLLSGTEIHERHATAWGEIGIVQAMFALLRAAADVPDNTHFLFLSESCIPIRTWESIRDSLRQDPRSRINLSSWDWMRDEHRHRVGMTCVAPSYWRSHSQWMLLDRPTVHFLLDHSDTTQKFSGVFCPDEHAIGTMLAIHQYDMNRIHKAPTTWSHWRGGNHPVTIGEIYPGLIQEWKNFDGFCARKISRNCSLPPLEELCR